MLYYDCIILGRLYRACTNIVSNNSLIEGGAGMEERSGFLECGEGSEG